MEKYMFKYLPLGLTCVALILQYNIFVTPEKLEIKHREILSSVSQNYVTKAQFDDLKGQLNVMQAKIDKIYDVIIDGGKNNVTYKY